MACRLAFSALLLAMLAAVNVIAFAAPQAATYDGGGSTCNHAPQSKNHCFSSTLLEESVNRACSWIWDPGLSSKNQWFQLNFPSKLNYSSSLLDPGSSAELEKSSFSMKFLLKINESSSLLDLRSWAELEKSIFSLNFLVKIN